MTVAPDRTVFALDRGALTLPDGPVLAVNPPGDADLDWAGAHDLRVVQGDAAAHAALARRGLDPVPEVTPDHAGAAAALVVTPRSRVLARLWLGQATRALAPGGLLIVEGAKTDGIDALWRECRPRLADDGVETKGHGRVFWGCPAAPFDDWIAAAADLPVIDGLTPSPGGFSADGADPGSVVLAAHLPDRLPPRVADLGAGWGWLTARILARDGVDHLDAVEADHAALTALRGNIADPRVAFHWADAATWRPDAPLDAVITNPPFHAGRRADPGLGRAFIATAAASLSPKGMLWLVANRHLPYEQALTERFNDVEETGGSPAYKILRAARPRRR